VHRKDKLKTTGLKVVFVILKIMWGSYLLKLATMMGMGRVMQSTPQMAHSDATSLPAEVLGAISPYPVPNRFVDRKFCIRIEQRHLTIIL
jgi:hypothetical protein